VDNLEDREKTITKTIVEVFNIIAVITNIKNQLKKSLSRKQHQLA
jgi:hypothetical protein